MHPKKAWKEIWDRPDEDGKIKNRPSAPLADWITASGAGLPGVMNLVIMKQNGWRGMMDGDESHSSDQL
jgi:hypothetical protein